MRYARGPLTLSVLLATASAVVELVPLYVVYLAVVDLIEGTVTADRLGKLEDTFPFDDTIKAKIAIGRPHATAGEVEAAVRAAGCHDFIAALPAGYQTPVGDRGARLSGGERQRITTVRAIVKDSPVVVLDEATAFTDPESEAETQDAISALVAGRTLIVVAHRLSTLTGADQIVVMNRGRIVDRGTTRPSSRAARSTRGCGTTTCTRSGSAAGWRLGAQRRRAHPELRLLVAGNVRDRGTHADGATVLRVEMRASVCCRESQLTGRLYV